MKKNVMMRLASFLLVAVLISTSAISGTYAKYVTEGTGTDSARVAKWGVEITANGSTFAEQYDTHDPSANTAVIGTKSVISTAASNADVTDNVVAPGTNGNMVAMQLSGAPEVAVEVKYEADLALTGWLVSYVYEGTTVPDEFYCPIEFKIGDEWVMGTSASSISNLEKAVEDKINAYTAQYPANTNLNDASVKTPVVAWRWAFEDGSELRDIKDTALGDASAAGNASTIALTVTTTVTQID